jgi:hypothetical protein
MRGLIEAKVQRAVAAAATLTGKRFGLFVASSLVATSAIVASAMTGAGGSGALAALLARGIVSHGNPALSAPAEAPAEVVAPAAASSSSATSEAAAGPSFSAPPAAAEPAPAGEPVPGKAPQPSEGEAAAEAGPVKHVFVISLTSPGYEQSLGGQSQMSYLSSTLRPQGELLSNYTLLGEGALPNGIAAVSGQPPNPATSAGCPGYEEFISAKASSQGVIGGSGCVYPVETMTLANQLELGKFSWRAYVAEMTDEAGQAAACVHPNPGQPSSAVEPGGYAASQNPFVYFHSLLDLGDCSEGDLPLEELSKDLGKAEKTPNYSFIAPTPCEAGAAGQCPAGAPEGPAAADAFLSAWVPKILASPAYKADGLLVVAFSAVDPSAPGTTPPADPLRTGALLLSPLLTPGATDGAAYDPYSLLRSTEDLFGLDSLALAGTSKTKSFASSLLSKDGGD